MILLGLYVRACVRACACACCLAPSHTPERKRFPNRDDVTYTISIYLPIYYVKIHPCGARNRTETEQNGTNKRTNERKGKGEKGKERKEGREEPYIHPPPFFHAGLFIFVISSVGVWSSHDNFGLGSLMCSCGLRKERKEKERKGRRKRRRRRKGDFLFS
ncbi:hypothetical protein F4809DRAFT_568340 [Biscogniauxia mediterranea]|nr:hypothetical protein F4809DRAFT_568340 [Biscogniauxia mediterranea]